jgi:hypothetical protein
MSVKFDQIAGGDPVGWAMKQIVVDDDAKSWPAQRVISSHQVLQFKSAVFADRLQRRDHIGEATTRP